MKTAETTCTTHASIAAPVLRRAHGETLYRDQYDWSLYQMIDGERIDIDEGSGLSVGDARSQAERAMACAIEWSGAEPSEIVWEIVK